MIKIYPVCKIVVVFKSLFYFPLSKNNYLQQLVLIGFKIEELAQNFKTGEGNFLTLVNNQNDNFFLVNAPAKNILLDDLFYLPFPGIFVRLFLIEYLCNCNKKFQGTAEIGIQDKVRIYFIIRCKIADKLPAEGGFASAHVAHNKIKAPAQAHREFNLLQAVQMLPGSVKKIGIR